MWGNTYKNDEYGVTACVAFTQRGADVLQHCHCELVEYPFEQVAEGQIKEPICYPGMGWNIVIALSKSNLVCMKTLVLASRIVGKLNRIINKVK